MKWFSEIVFVDQLPRGGPATVNRLTGKLTLAREYWDQFDDDTKAFVLLHELGHLVLNSSDEKEVDLWALKQYTQQGWSLKKAVYSLTKVLPFTRMEHLERLKQQLATVRHFDYHYNGNQKAIQWKTKIQ